MSAADPSPMDPATLLAALRSLEVELHHPGVRSSRARLDELLHPDFNEVGRSGRPYDRQTVIDHLVAEGPQGTTESGEFTVALLGPGLALLGYRSAQRQPDGMLALHTLRSSVWAVDGGRWRLRYHQGTPAATAW